MPKFIIHYIVFTDSMIPLPNAITMSAHLTSVCPYNLVLESVTMIVETDTDAKELGHRNGSLERKRKELGSEGLP